MKRIALAAMAAAALLAACSRTEPKAVPRREGYPRAAMYEGQFAPVEQAPLRLLARSELPAQVDVRGNSAVWATVEYPAYHARVLYTFTPATPATAPAIVDNRAERISLNLGGATASVQQAVNEAGYSVTLVSAPSVTHMPLQFVAAPAAWASGQGDSGERGWVLSGSVFFYDARPQTPADSLAPMVHAIKADLALALDSLSNIQP